MSEGKKGVIVVAGSGPGISAAVASKFGKERGYSVALLSRTQSKLDAAVAELTTMGVKAAGFAVDLLNPEATVATIKEVQKQLGEISILFWNAGPDPKPLLDMTSTHIHQCLSLSVESLLFASKAAMDDLERNKGAVLVTGGSTGMENDEAAQMAVDWGVATWALNKAALRKLVHLMHVTLKPRGIFVGEVTVCSGVKYTAFDPEGKCELTKEEVADAFANHLDKRDAPFTQIGKPVVVTSFVEDHLAAAGSK